VTPVDVAFVTVNYNTLRLVKQLTVFLETLVAPFTYSLTIVDNNSTDGSQEFLRTYAGIKYLQTGENIGYGRAINCGVAATDSKYVCVTNTDVILNREALVSLWRFMEERPEVGVCAPRITYEDGRDQGMVFNRSLFAHYANWFAKVLAIYSKLKVARATAPFRVDGVMGAFFVIRRSVVPPPALFDKDFFFFHEDMALAHTLKNRGTPCFVVPNAKILHVSGKSRAADAVKLFYESKYLYLKKFYGPVHAKGIYSLDRARILRRWSFYSLLARLGASERIDSKRRYYEIAWNSVRLN
jgi:N-acetylglucosaminyl-diphospho-decaprenol L-rhamnosyltransferase